MSTPPEKGESLTVLTDWEEVPKFAGLEEEADYWQRHQIDGRLMLNALAKADHAESTTITLRMDPRMLSRLKRLARQRYLNYQSMLKQWVAERLEQESD
ncbi:MAG: CopG family antitoxin [Verrucomicrobiota bacterium]